ncbi:SDR family NAD(P)-dependent oxidoreductase [Robbsia sp. KACC 23696]|uniref:SDR family NAD(P)-dependent oxidoreductase n=1 Tax=Robbsia sp. KACC 23696 TaxID=3149231 RepID=UPI00325BC764
MPKLDGKTALITGGNSGIGLAIARRFVAEGARVFITGRRQAQLDAAVAQIGGSIEGIHGDVTNASDLDRLFETLRTKIDNLDILVPSSGISERQMLDETTEDHFTRIFDVNVRGMVSTVQRAVRQMSNGGSIVLIGSIAGSIGNPGYGAYSASKAAVRSYSRTWSKELMSRGIRVNTLSPGLIDTPMFDTVSAEVREALSALIPMDRMGRAEEVANAALFLASSESSYVAGAELFIDGGLIG